EEAKAKSLSGQSMLLLAVNGLFAVANALSGTFVNVYLWKVKNDYTLIAWFAISTQVTMALTFWIVGKWVKEHNKMHSLRLGVAISAVFYLIILWLGVKSVDYVIGLGIIMGLAFGFFWLAFNVVYFEVTNPQTRDKFNGWAGLLGSGAGMIAPWLSGYLITHMKNTTGYRLIFTLSLVTFLMGVVVSFFLKKRKVQQSYNWMYGYHQLLQPANPWRKIALALVAQGMREGVFGFIIGLLVYIYTKNEMKLGNFSLISSAVGFVSFMVVGKWLKPKRRKLCMFIGVVMMILVILPFFWQVSYSTLLVFGVGTSLFIPLFTIPITSVVFDMIGKNEESANNRVEYIVLREVALNTGRMLGTLIFIAVVSWSAKPLTINLLLLGLGSTPFLAWLLMRPWLNRVHT
ncbi:MAG: transporter, partial [Bacilli bacterium]|nr:transporter [Bacilli bacterium]